VHLHFFALVFVLETEGLVLDVLLRLPTLSSGCRRRLRNCIRCRATHACISSVANRWVAPQRRQARSAPGDLQGHSNAARRTRAVSMRTHAPGARGLPLPVPVSRTWGPSPSLARRPSAASCRVADRNRAAHSMPRRRPRCGANRARLPAAPELRLTAQSPRGGAGTMASPGARAARSRRSLPPPRAPSAPFNRFTGPPPKSLLFFRAPSWTTSVPPAAWWAARRLKTCVSVVFCRGRVHPALVSRRCSRAKAFATQSPLRLPPRTAQVQPRIVCPNPL
jgi:hypothetical protein